MLCDNCGKILHQYEDESFSCSFCGYEYESINESCGGVEFFGFATQTPKKEGAETVGSQGAPLLICARAALMTETCPVCGGPLTFEYEPGVCWSATCLRCHWACGGSL